MHPTKASFQIFLMKRPNFLQVLLQWDYQIFRQHSNAVFISFAFSNNNFPSRKFNILNAQSQRFQ